MEHPPPKKKTPKKHSKQIEFVNINDPRCGQYDIWIVIYVSNIVCKRKKGSLIFIMIKGQLLLNMHKNFTCYGSKLVAKYLQNI